MINSTSRYKGNQKYIKNRFNQKVNKTKRVNKATQQRGGIKL